MWVQGVEGYSDALPLDMKFEMCRVSAVIAKKLGILGKCHCLWPLTFETVS